MNGPTPRDWAGLAFLALVWGSAFVVIEGALEGVGPGMVAFGRLSLGAALLTVWAYARGRRLPALNDKRWLWFLALGFFGNALPFFLIPLAQETIPSALAGILLAVMPLTTITLAHAFTAEKMTPRTLVGFLIGFAGVIVLTGPSALRDLGGPAFIAQLLVLAAALSYAVNVIIVRRAPETAPGVAAAGMLIGGAILAVPMAAWEIATDRSGFDASAWGLVALLGVGPTAAASIAYIAVIRSAGAGFISLVNYLVPIVALAAGLAIGEAVAWHAVAGLVIILGGVALAQGRRPVKPPA